MPNSAAKVSLTPLYPAEGLAEADVMAAEAAGNVAVKVRDMKIQAGRLEVVEGVELAVVVAVEAGIDEGGDLRWSRLRKNNLVGRSEVVARAFGGEGRSGVVGVGC